MLEPSQKNKLIPLKFVAGLVIGLVFFKTGLESAEANNIKALPLRSAILFLHLLPFSQINTPEFRLDLEWWGARKKQDLQTPPDDPRAHYLVPSIRTARSSEKLKEIQQWIEITGDIDQRVKWYYEEHDGSFFERAVEYKRRSQWGKGDGRYHDCPGKVDQVGHLVYEPCLYGNEHHSLSPLTHAFLSENLSAAALLISYGAPLEPNLLHILASDNSSSRPKGAAWKLLTLYIKAGGPSGIARVAQVPSLQELFHASRAKLITSVVSSPFYSPVTGGVEHIEAALRQLAQDPVVQNMNSYGVPQNTGLSNPLYEDYINKKDSNGFTALARAVIARHFNFPVPALIALGADLSIPPPDNWSLLMPVLDYPEYIQALLNEGLSALQKDPEGYSVLDYAGKRFEGWFSKESHLVITTLCQSVSPDTTFHLAGSQITCADWINENFEQYGASFKNKINKLRTLKTLNKDQYFPETIEQLVQNNKINGMRDMASDISLSDLDNLIKRHEYYNFHPSRLLYKSTNLKMIRTLLEWGASPDIDRQNFGYSDGYYNNFNIFNNVKLLRKPQSSPFISSIRSGNLDLVKLYLEYGSDIGQNGIFAAAIESGQPDLLLFFLDMGISVSYFLTSELVIDTPVKTLENTRGTIVSKDINLLLNLYITTRFERHSQQPLTEQQFLDQMLDLAIIDDNPKAVALALSRGANPNIDCGWRYDSSGQDGCRYGVLYALLKASGNPNSPSIVRLLLLFGGSATNIVMDYKAPFPYWKQETVAPADYHLQNPEVSDELIFSSAIKYRGSYLDINGNLQPFYSYLNSPVSTLGSCSKTNYAYDTLLPTFCWAIAPENRKVTLIQHLNNDPGYAVNDDSGHAVQDVTSLIDQMSNAMKLAKVHTDKLFASPVCTCLNLKKDSYLPEDAEELTDFYPYCQRVRDQLSDSTKQLLNNHCGVSSTDSVTN